MMAECWDDLYKRSTGVCKYMGAEALLCTKRAQETVCKNCEWFQLVSREKAVGLKDSQSTMK